MKTTLSLLFALSLTSDGTNAAADAQRGQEIIQKLVEVNRYWLTAPPAQVKEFSYTLNRVSGTQQFTISDPAKAPRARRQGVTYSTLLQQLARAPGSASVTEIIEEPGKLRLALAFEPEISGAIGNGVENSWNGYHSFRAKEGYVVVDSARWVPLEVGLGKLTETFAEFAPIDATHFAPLAIRLQLDDTRYDWHFRLYDGGLWLFDEGFSGERRLAWVEDVKLNAAPAKLLKATGKSLEFAQRAELGQVRLQAFVQANRAWLLPSLPARRGLVYEYRQETPYLETVRFDESGNLLARLEATKDKPDRPSSQKLWLADGRSYSGDAADQFVKLDGAANTAADAQAWLKRDRLVQHVAMGLALECAVTRLAREPENFQAEVRELPDQANRYLLVLHPKGDARLFTGTMLTFSSWAFMHDVRFDRSEIVCDAATHRALVERDYASEKEPKGEYFFEEWMDDAAGAAPRRIRAVIPNERDGKDQALEMTAQFHFARPGLWLLSHVESHFRGGDSGSTGTLTLVPTTPESYQPIEDVRTKATWTEQVLGAVEHAPVGTAEGTLKPGEWTPLELQAAWNEKAREAAKGGERETKGPLLIGLYRSRLTAAADRPMQLELEGLSTVAWKEFETDWQVIVRDNQGRTLSTVTTNLTIRSEGAPGAFVVQVPLARSGDPVPTRVTVTGNVQRMSGAYHGHGMWMRFMAAN